MAGYDGKSMSNNAREAYADGMKPISKWTKKDLLSHIHGEKLKTMAMKHTREWLQKRLLLQCGWHHTSSRFNRTYFYEFNDSLDDDELEELLSIPEKKRMKAAKPDPSIFHPVMAHWNVAERNGGHRTVYAFGRRNATWFYDIENNRKRLNGPTFYYLPLDEEEAKKEFMKATGFRNAESYEKWLRTGSLE